MRTSVIAMIMMALGGCAVGQEDDRVMIALVIENEMDRHVVSSNVEFTPESGVHVFGNIVSGGNRGNLGFPVNAVPTAMEVTYWVATKAGINPMEVDGNTEREKVVRSVELFAPERNPNSNYPEFHLVIRPDGSIEQVRDIDVENAEQRKAAAEQAAEDAESEVPSDDAQRP